jgi:glycosyltransferase involved in cell wall biosynthesis
VINQSLKEIEIICIDDCSPDNCLKILQEYAKKDPRIRVIRHPKNRGPSAARNSGLEVAAGEYIGFVDSDDYIHPDMYSIMYNEIRKGNHDLLMCEFSDVNKFEGDHWERNPVYQVTKHDGCSEMMEYYLHRFSVIWNKLYKKSILDRVKFAEELPCEEDFYFNLCVSKFVGKSAHINAILYHYRQRNESIMHSPFPREKVDAIIRMVEYIRSGEVALTERLDREVCIRELRCLLVRSLFLGSDGAFWYSVKRIKDLYSRDLISFGELLTVGYKFAKRIVIYEAKLAWEFVRSLISSSLPGISRSNTPQSS